MIKKFATILFASLSFNFTCSFAQTEVKIGNQIWMTKNLNVNKFQNGDPIPLVKDNKAWKAAYNEKKPACSYYENDFELGKTYGLLYNWYAVIDPRGLAPEGWRIPTVEDFKELINFSGGDSSSAIKLKSKENWTSIETKGICDNCKNWKPEEKAMKVCSICQDKREVDKIISGNGNNETGFNALPAGHREDYGNFFSIEYRAYFYSSTKDKENENWQGADPKVMVLFHNLNNAQIKEVSEEEGLSIRLIKK